LYFIAGNERNPVNSTGPGEWRFHRPRYAGILAREPEQTGAGGEFERNQSSRMAAKSSVPGRSTNPAGCPLDPAHAHATGKAVYPRTRRASGKAERTRQHGRAAEDRDQQKRNGPDGRWAGM